jgi:hypothetical protein
MVPMEMVDTCWDQVEPYLAKACKFTYGRYNTDDVLEMINEGIYHLWVAFEPEEENAKIYGAVVTQFMGYPRSKYLSLTFCGGKEFKRWHKPMISLLKKFAADMGCDGIEATARRGWSRLLASDGYNARWVTFELPLEGV